MKNFLKIMLSAILVLGFSNLTSAQKSKSKSPTRDLKSKTASTQNSSKSKTAETTTEAIPTETKKPSKTNSKTGKKVIAISNFYNAVVGNTEPQVGRQLIALFESEFTKNGAYQVAATQQLQQILEKQDISFDERMDPATASKIGKIASANIFVYGNITEFNLTKGGFNIGLLGGKTTYTAKLGLTVTLFDVDTGIALKSVQVDATAKDSSNKILDFNQNSEMSQDLRNRLFTEAANKAVKSAVEQLSPVIENSVALAGSVKDSGAAEIKQSTDNPDSASRSISNSPKNAGKVSRIIKGVVYLTGLDGAKIGDILSVKRGASEGKEIAVIEVTEVNERTVKAKIIDGAGVQTNDRVEIIQ